MNSILHALQVSKNVAINILIFVLKGEEYISDHVHNLSLYLFFLLSTTWMPEFQMHRFVYS